MLVECVAHRDCVSDVVCEAGGVKECVADEERVAGAEPDLVTVAHVVGLRVALPVAERGALSVRVGDFEYVGELDPEREPVTVGKVETVTDGDADADGEPESAPKTADGDETESVPVPDPDVVGVVVIERDGLLDWVGVAHADELTVVVPESVDETDTVPERESETEGVPLPQRMTVGEPEPEKEAHSELLAEPVDVWLFVVESTAEMLTVADTVSE